VPQTNSAPAINPADETISFAGLDVRFLLTGEQTNGTLAMFELSVAAGKRLPAPAHSHDHYEETIYSLEGTVTMTVNGTPIDIGPGDSICIPRGAIHRFDNDGAVDAKGLCVVTPAAIGPEYFREVYAVFQHAAGGPPDRAKMMEIMHRHGLTPAPPPPAAGYPMSDAV
jgi:quercetin dioxygenase-like cupin family protein